MARTKQIEMNDTEDNSSEIKNMDINEILEKININNDKMSSLNRINKNFSKELERQIKKLAKESTKRSKKANPDAPKKKTGFTKESSMPEEIYMFIKNAYDNNKLTKSKVELDERYPEFNKDTKLPRTLITRIIHDYIKTVGVPATKRVYDFTNFKEIKDLFMLTDDDVVTFFNIQKFLRRAFKKDDVQDAKIDDTETADMDKESSSDEEIQVAKKVAPKKAVKSLSKNA